MGNTMGKRNIIRHRQLKAEVGFRVNKEKHLRCVDVVFALMTKNLNSMSEIVYNFTRETKILNNFVENISFDEKRSMTMRAYNAKECAIELTNEIQDKRKFLNKYKKVGQTGLLSFETITQIRFMESRAYELDLMMDAVRAKIDIAIEKYGRIIDHENTRNSNKLNEIMAVFTLFSISCIPATVVGGLFGMNVKVPFMNDEDHESLYPFMVIVLAMLLSGVSFYLFFSWWLKNAELN